MISLYDMLEAADGQLFGEPAAQIFTDFARDVEQVEQGSLFVVLPTDQGDVQQRMQAAVARGALGLICTNPPEFDTDGITVMVVRSVEHALLNWARGVMNKLGTTVIGVTGSAGKSTTRAAIAAVLGTRYNVYQNADRDRGVLGLAMSLGRLSAEHHIAVLELASERPHEMTELVEIIHPLVGVVTNIGQSHLELFGSVERIAQEEAILIDSLPKGGLAVLNYDAPLVRAMGEQTGATRFSIGIDSFDADLMAYNIVLGRYKTGFDLRYGSERLVGRWVPLLGRHQLYAVMAALAVGLGYQVPLEEGLKALTQIEPLPGRLRLLNGEAGCLLVDDTFSAGPESTAAALEWLDAIREEDSRAIVVLGDLDEMGRYATRAHRLLGEKVAAVADRFITQGNQAAIAGRAALDYGMSRSQVRMTYSHHDAFAVLHGNLGPDDVVLVVGSRAARMEEVVRLLLADEADERLLARRSELTARRGQIRSAYPSWIEVDLDAAAENVRRVCDLIGPDVALMAMVPADAYGHGAVAVGATAILNGAAYLGVSSLEEAVALRDGGLDAPILVMGYVLPTGLRDAIRYDVAVALYDLAAARLGNRLAGEMHRRLRVHVVIDSGLGHLGLLPGEVTGFFRRLNNLKNLELEGVYTELADDEDRARRQLDVFNELLGPLRASGLPIRYIHAAGTTAMLALPDSHFTMVHAGGILHGLASSPQTPLPEGFRPTLQWKTVIAQVKTIPRGSFLAGQTRRARDDMQIAVIPVGYADGFRATPKHWQAVLVHGQRVPVIPPVGLHETALDVSAVPAVQAGDEVVLIGSQHQDMIRVEEAAGWLDCGIFELLSTILARTPRL